MGVIVGIHLSCFSPVPIFNISTILSPNSVMLYVVPVVGDDSTVPESSSSTGSNTGKDEQSSGTSDVKVESVDLGSDNQSLPDSTSSSPAASSMPQVQSTVVSTTPSSATEALSADVAVSR